MSQSEQWLSGMSIPQSVRVMMHMSVSCVPGESEGPDSCSVSCCSAPAPQLLWELASILTLSAGRAYPGLVQHESSLLDARFR